MAKEILDLSEGMDIFDMLDIRNQALIKVTVQSLQALFAGRDLPNHKIKGTRGQIDSFLKTLMREKKYMSSVIENGLEDPRTYRQKAYLDVATRNFKTQTGMEWPIG
jgi:predicted lipoprotein